MKTKFTIIASICLLVSFQSKAQFNLTSTGIVGIGISAPQANLHIKYNPSINNYAYLRLESQGIGQNASMQYVTGGVFRWELGTGISSGTAFELMDRVNSKSMFTIQPGGVMKFGTSSYPWLFDIYTASGDPLLYAGNDWGVLGTENAPLFKIFSNNIWCKGIWLTSDEKLKTNIKNMSGCLKKVRAVNGVKYDFKVTTNDSIPTIKKEEIRKQSTNRFGFIAQDLKKIFPELVHYDSIAGHYSVDYIGMIPVLVEALKDQQLQIDSLRQALNKKGSTKSATSQDDATSISTKTNGLSLTEVATLSQNSPNPFSQSTTIGYYLHESVNNASIYIYDMNGVEIKSYPLASKGSNSITINGYELKPGMYLYALIADGQEIATKRMVLTQ